MIGLIFGETNFPIEILKKIKKKRLKYLIIDLSKSNKFKKDKNSHNVSIGQFGTIINILKKNKCSKEEVFICSKLQKVCHTFIIVSKTQSFTRVKTSLNLRNEHQILTFPNRNPKKTVFSG